MKGYCESCGRYPRLQQRLLGGGLALSEDRTIYLCRDCRRGMGSLATANWRTSWATEWLGRNKLAVSATSLLAAVTVVSLFVLVPARPSVTGEVLGAIRPGPGDVPVDKRPVVASPSNVPDRNSAAVRNGGPGDLQTDPALSMGQAAIRTWKDSFGRSRLQVILPVRNDDTRWVRFLETSSLYRIVGDAGEVASGAFIALPAVIGPDETAYLVDTISIPGVERTRGLLVEPEVAGLPTDPSTTSFSITGLRLVSGIGGDMRATGLVHNEGGRATTGVIAGAIVLDRDGRPLGAVYDTFDVGRLGPSETRKFVTDFYPGGPPVDESVIGELIGAAFEMGT